MVVVMVQTFLITGWIPEQLANGPQGSWRSTWRKKKDAAEMAYCAARQEGWDFMPGKVRMVITYIFPQKRTRDIDGLVSRSKGLIDGLKGHFFQDDDTEHLDLSVKAEVIPGIKATRVTLTSLGE